MEILSNYVDLCVCVCSAPLTFSVYWKDLIYGFPELFVVSASSKTSRGARGLID